MINRLAINLGLEDYDPLTAFQLDPCGETLSHINKELQTPEMVQQAIEKDHDNYYSILKFISKKLQTPDMVEQIIKSQTTSDSALKYVSKRLITKELCALAVRTNGNNIEYVPKDFLSRQLCIDSVVFGNASLSSIPSEYVDGLICELAVSNNGLNLRNVPSKYKTRGLCEIAIKQNGDALEYVPKKYSSKRLCALAAQSKEVVHDRTELSSDSSSMQSFLDDLNIYDLKILKNAAYSEGITLEEYYEKYYANDEYSKEPNYRVLLKAPSQLPLQSFNDIQSNDLVNNEEKDVIHDLIQLDCQVQRFYYISDLHLEHQLNLIGKDIDEVEKIIDKKVKELVSTTNNDFSDILLVAGDVADSIALTTLFYKSLNMHFCGQIVSVLGNHELWDDSIKETNDLIQEYSGIIEEYAYQLENEILICYKNNQWQKIGEKVLLNADENELADICEKSSIIILGGLGFSGQNPIYNANLGLYGTRVSMSDDRILTDRFRLIYEKMIKVAGNLAVIVLTHTPIENWTKMPCNPNWIYVNGHTHHNYIVLDENRKIMADNQIGYIPRQWGLKGFVTNKKTYDPFEHYKDGIYRIDNEDYKNFNQCKDIIMEDFKQTGQVFMLKRDDNYLFLLEKTTQKLKGRSLYILNGGALKKLDNPNINYYYDNLTEYCVRIEKAVKPYYDVLKELSKEIVTLGGSGTIHGCIVDIDFFNHIYLNPFDGKITPYFAYSIDERIVFDDFNTLLKSSPMPPNLTDGIQKADRENKDSLTLLKGNTCSINKARVPQIVLGQAMYKPSRFLRSIQYLYDQNVVRVWDDSFYNEARISLA